MEKHPPYKKSENLLTPTEADFYVYLKAAVNNDFHINKMTRMCDLVDVDKGLSNKEYMSYFRSISQYHIDFTLCNPYSFKPVLCIELDDPSHGRADRIKRDDKVNKIFADINLPLLRIKAERTYRVEYLRSLIDRNLTDADRKPSGPGNHHTSDKAPIGSGINIYRTDPAGESDRQDRNRKILVSIFAGLLTIFASIFMLFTFKNLATKMLTGPATVVVKNNISKPGYASQRKTTNLSGTRNPSELEPRKTNPQPSVSSGTNDYTIADITVTAPRKPQANKANKSATKEVTIKPQFYTGDFTVEMIWEGNYKSGNGLIALLNCGAQCLLIEQLASGLQLEQPVKKLTKETHTELLPTTKYSSSYYMITGNGTLQEWDNSGKVNEFKRRT